MDFDFKVNEVWANEGAEPDEQRKANGFEGGYFPPAGIFNWFFHNSTGSIKELQEKFKAHAEDEENPHDVTASDVGALPKEGGELTGELIVNDNFYVKKSFDGVPYRSYVRPINYSINGDGQYSTGLIHYNNGVNHAQLMFNKDGVLLRDNVNGKAYHVFGQYNVDQLEKLFLSLATGGTLKGDLEFQKANNGKGVINKNHNSTNDYGLIIKDIDGEGKQSLFTIRAKDNTLRYQDSDGNTCFVGKIHTSYYTGADAKTKQLTYPFVPKIVFVSSSDGKYSTTLINSCTQGFVVFRNGTDTDNSRYATINWSGNSVSLTSKESNAYALNASNTTYQHIAIG